MHPKHAEYQKRWNAKNPEKVREISRRHMAARRAADPEGEKAYHREYRSQNLEKVRAQARDRRTRNKAQDNLKQRERRKRIRSTPEGWLKLALWAARDRCGVDHREFDLKPEDITIPAVCPITKRPFNFGGGNYDRSAPSLDRINPNGGYTKGNVRVISQYANTLRQDCTDPAIFQALAGDARNLFGVTVP